MKIQNKEKTLFWLRRRLTQLEKSFSPPTQDEMARLGIPYGDRQKIIDEASKGKEANQAEAESLQTAIGFIEETG